MSLMRELFPRTVMYSGAKPFSIFIPSLLFGKSRICPLDAITVYFEPKKLEIFFAFVGDSTIIKSFDLAVVSCFLLLFQPFILVPPLYQTVAKDTVALPCDCLIIRENSIVVKDKFNSGTDKPVIIHNSSNVFRRLTTLYIVILFRPTQFWFCGLADCSVFSVFFLSVYCFLYCYTANFQTNLSLHSSITCSIDNSRVAFFEFISVFEPSLCQSVRSGYAEYLLPNLPA